MEIKVSIIEDNPDFLESLSFMLGMSDGFTCVGEYGSVEEALCDNNTPDVILLDIHLPGISGIEGIAELKKKYPSASIIMITVFDDDENIFRAILAGADGYILKKTQPARILQSIEDAYTGGSPMSPQVARQAMSLFKSFAPRMQKESLLSPRETEVLSFVVKGMGNDEISEALFISTQTVRNHIKHIYEKLHVHSKSQAVLKAVREGYV